MDLTKNEKWLLRIIEYFDGKEENVNLKLLNELKEKYSKEEFQWIPIIEKMINEKLIYCDSDFYYFTDKGVSERIRIISNGFNKALIDKDRSTAFRKFTEKIHGIFLCQMNMTTMNQLNKLIESLGINDKMNVLDIGCGMGRITEWISDQTGCKITGVDFADKAIEAANKRVESKSDRISYVTGNLDNLDFEANHFDVIISIDTLYFAKDLKKTMTDLKAFLKPDGKMGLFYSQTVKGDDDQSILEPDNTKLAKVLKQLNLSYEYFEYTEEEEQHWKDELKYAEELKSEFEKEDLLYIYKSRIGEATTQLNYFENKRGRRFLYIIESNK